jgi:hypothetical protein
MAMMVIEKNNGTYIPIVLSGTELLLGEGELKLDLALLESDHPVHIDISEDRAGRLVLGPALRYMAEIDIPARQYRIKTGPADDLGFPKLTKFALPLDANSISLTLWAVEV